MVGNTCSEIAMAAATLNKISNISTLCRLLNNVSLNKVQTKSKIPILISLRRYGKRNFSTTSSRNDLMEFFDDKKHWGEHEVKSGRSWKKEELRIKSNVDLHKLWYVLIKERNMLLTMEHEAKDKVEVFPSPERLDKVEESMENLETVIRERNVAYHQLETGETGERPGKLQKNAFGLKEYYKMAEYPLPKHMNKKWHETHYPYQPNRDTEAFLLKYREKLYLNKRRKNVRDFNHVIGLMNRFPNMDMEAVKEQYPDVDIEKAKRSRRYKGHFLPK